MVGGDTDGMDVIDDDAGANTLTGSGSGAGAAASGVENGGANRQVSPGGRSAYERTRDETV